MHLAESSDVLLFRYMRQAVECNSQLSRINMTLLGLKQPNLVNGETGLFAPITPRKIAPTFWLGGKLVRDGKPIKAASSSVVEVGASTTTTTPIPVCFNCLRNQCRCHRIEGGHGANGTSCSEMGVTKCDSCHSGYKKNPTNECRAICKCPHGIPWEDDGTANSKCNKPGLLRCKICNYVVPERKQHVIYNQWERGTRRYDRMRRGAVVRCSNELMRGGGNELRWNVPMS